MPQPPQLVHKCTVSLPPKLLGKPGPEVVRPCRALIPGDLEPIELTEDILQILGPGAKAIGVIDAQAQHAACLAHHQPGEDEIDRVAEMEQAAGGGSNAGTDHLHSPDRKRG